MKVQTGKEIHVPGNVSDTGGALEYYRDGERAVWTQKPLGGPSGKRWAEGAPGPFVNRTPKSLPVERPRL